MLKKYWFYKIFEGLIRRCFFLRLYTNLFRTLHTICLSSYSRCDLQMFICDIICTLHMMTDDTSISLRDSRRGHSVQQKKLKTQIASRCPPAPVYMGICVYRSMSMCAYMYIDCGMFYHICICEIGLFLFSTRNYN